MRGCILALAALMPTSALAQDFTLMTAGDLIISRPVSQLARGGAFPPARELAETIALLGDADVTIGNMETTIQDIRRFSGHPYSWDGDWMLRAEPAVAADLKRMHFDMVGTANNHALDWGVEGMRETAVHLDRAGLIRGGTGATARDAGSAGFFESRAGRVGLIALVSTFRPTTNALDPDAGAPSGRPGVNGLKVVPTLLVDATAYRALSEMACGFDAAPSCPARTGTIDIFGTRVRQAGAGGGLHLSARDGCRRSCARPGLDP